MNVHLVAESRAGIRARGGPVPMPDALTGATALARLIRERTISPVDACDACIAHIERVNPRINAVVADRFDAARAEAREAGRALETGAPVGPLHGVPFSVKEMISLDGMPHTFGSPTRAGRTADGDATIVARLRRAGAIPIGVTNVPEWGFWFETHNLVYGRTSNPWDASRTSGGSSGGEAAIVAAGGVPFGVGSDIGGSIRIPAAFCGVFGHKATHGLLPLTGHYPVYAKGPDASLRGIVPWLSMGPITRTAADLMPLLRVMAGPDGVDPNAEPIDLGSPEGVEWEGRKVLLLDDPDITFSARGTRDVIAATRAAAGALAARGAIVEPLPRSIFRDAARIWFAALRSTGGPTLRETAGGGRPIHLLPELARTITGNARVTLPVLMFCIGESLGRLEERWGRELVEEGRALDERLGEMLGSEGILLMPAHPRTAPRHRTPMLRPIDFAWTAILNVLRMPVTVAPVGLSAKGLPLSVQIGAARGNDHRTIAAAMVLEEAFPPAFPASAGGAPDPTRKNPNA
jgi:fatty acid amide hydrolase 2